MFQKAYNYSENGAHHVMKTFKCSENGTYSKIPFAQRPVCSQGDFRE